MEQNYNFNINPKKPTSEEVHNYMNFDALLGQMEEQPAVLRTRFRVHRLVYISGVAAAVLMLLMFIPNLTKVPTIDENTYFSQQAFVNPPLPKIETHKEIEKIADAHQGGIIEYASGSRLVIPAAAFMNDKSKLVGGEIEVHYRELHDFVDFFVSGVPMAYDSVGLKRYLTSSGMVEIYAEQNGKRLELVSGKAIQVELVSEVVVDDYFTLPSYSVYQLDTVNRNWEYRNIDMVQFVEEDQWAFDGQLTPQQLWQQQLIKLNESYQQAIADLQIEYPLPAAPYKPTQANGNRRTIELDFQNGPIPLDPNSQIQQKDIDRLHNGTIWEIAPESEGVDSRAFKVVWESVRLEKLDQHRYVLTLVHSKNEESLIVEPVLLGEDYQKAMNVYQFNLQAYNQAVAQRETQITTSRDSLQGVFNDKKLSLQYEFENQLQNNGQPLKRKLINRFVVNEFGIWTCGRAVTAQKSVENVSFVDQSGQAFEEITAYVVNQEQNTLYRYMASDAMSIHLEKDTKHLLWVTDKEGNFSLSKIEQVSDDGSEVALMPVVDNPIQSEKELREVLKF